MMMMLLRPSLYTVHTYGISNRATSGWCSVNDVEWTLQCYLQILRSACRQSVVSQGCSSSVLTALYHQACLRWIFNSWRNIMFSDGPRFCPRQFNQKTKEWRTCYECCANCCTHSLTSSGGDSVTVLSSIIFTGNLEEISTHADIGATQIISVIPQMPILYKCFTI